MSKKEIIKKEIRCLRCKKSFKTELDSIGIPYNKICSRCKKNTINYGNGIKGKL